MDRCLGECPNTFAYEVPRASANPLRALVFDKNPIAAVQFRIDGSTTWQNMQPVDGGPVWQGFGTRRLLQLETTPLKFGHPGQLQIPTRL
jgi:hypothetical protein